MSQKGGLGGSVVGRNGAKVWEHMSTQPCGAHRGYLVHLASCRTGLCWALRTAFSRDSDDDFILDTRRRTSHQKKELMKFTSIGKIYVTAVSATCANTWDSSSCHPAFICNPGLQQASVFPRSVGTLGRVCLPHLLLTPIKAQITIKKTQY